MRKKIVIYLFLIFVTNLGAVFAQDREGDSLALVELYDSTDGDNWTNNTNWKSGPIDTWYGVTVTGGRVTTLLLLNNNLVGSIPAEIGNLTSLHSLRLYDNQLTGSIPPGIGNLTSLTRLELNDNQLTDSIPPGIGNLTSLQILRLNNNQLTGSIPSGIENLTSLHFLYLNNNQLTGSIPLGIVDLTSLQELYLNFNQLTDSIPSSIGSLTNLTELYLNFNQLTGPIPPSIGSLTNLTQLYLNVNYLTDSIPSSIGSLTNLTQLYLNDNQLTNSIPSSIGNLTNLQYLRLSSNQLTGSIPPGIGNLTTLRYLRLNNNELTGSIPPEIGNLMNLQILYLNDNQLTDSIPPEIGNLTSVQDLDLNDNELTGSIPAEIGDLTSLHFLYLNDNQLTGSIPAEIVNLTSLQDLILHGNDFVNLPSLLGLPSLQYLSIQNNKFTFEDIEPNIGVASVRFTYSPQDSVGEIQNEVITEGSNFTMSVSVGGENNQYQWKKGGSIIPGATNHSYTIISAEISDAGSYTCEITNTVATELTLYSKPIDVTVNPLSPGLTVTSPNGGEDWKVDSTYDITWTSSPTSSNVKIEYSIDNGSNWLEIITAIPADALTYSWIIPDTPSDSCLVRITDTTGSPSDTSDAIFSISHASAVPFSNLPEVYSLNVKGITANKNLELGYTLPVETDIRFRLYDITGKIVREISREEQAGFHSEKINTTDIPSGVYFVRMEANGAEFTETDKFVLIK
ncbi:MAG: leucine-rich repeat domain-containing protein [candidate division WOR-3 bacterium]